MSPLANSNLNSQSFAGRVGGNQLFALGPSDCVGNEPADARQDATWKQILDLRGFRDAQLWKKAFIEGFGLCLQVFIAGIVAAGVIPLAATTSVGSLIPVGVAAIIQFIVITLFILAAGPLTSLPRAVLYVVSQCAGAIIGGFLLRAALDISAEALSMSPGCYIDPTQVTPASAFVLETMTSLFLLFLAFGLGLDPRNSASFGPALGPFLIGASAATTLFAGGMARKGYLGSANNPARCLGLMTASNRFTYHYVHWAGDVVAAMYVARNVHTKAVNAVPSPLRRSRDQSSHDKPQKRAKLVHKIQEEHEDTSRKVRPEFKLCCALTGRHSRIENGLDVEVKQEDPNAEEMYILPTTEKLLEIFSFPRIDRKRGRPDEAEGPSYALHDSTTTEVAGDSRAEMSYLSRDKEIADLFNDLWNSVDTLSSGHFSDAIPDAEKQNWLLSVPKMLHPKRAQDCEFVDLVAQIAVGGPCGIGSWEQIFLEPELRRGLVCGIIWRKLQIEVFDKMLFGGSDSQEKELLELEKGMAEHSDGFMRTRARALKIREMLDCPNPADPYTISTGKHNLPPSLDEARQTLTKQLQSLLRCLTPRSSTSHVLTALEEITRKAALLSHLLRLDTETIYYSPFMEKDSRPHFDHPEENVTYFSTEHKEWVSSAENRADKTVPHPQLGLTEEKVKRIHCYDPLIRIICSGAVETYRKGGWRPNDAEKGVRKRILFPARVILRWGRPQEKSCLPNGYQKPESRNRDSLASYLSFRQALAFLGAFRDRIALETFGEEGELPWYLHRRLLNGVRDPAWSVEGYPVLGERGTGNQPSGLTMFRPSRTPMF
ncbi:hypothetical protein EG328_007484 [Venturia inaequalis]|uniref:Uncharacterized protein n=1 Tax=Venturia inaequalis TaxID=5025 RepID=A0A8H3YPI6_VENIN|nr:hypothetical protein EG328_007484 [Venturia inaequalis]